MNLAALGADGAKIQALVGVCVQHVITDKKTLSSRHIADLPLEACDGNVSLIMEEFLNLRTFIRGK